MLKENESNIIQNLLRFNTIVAKSIMTPRTVVHAASEKNTLQAFYEANQNLQFSRIPIYHEGSKDHVTGYFIKNDLFSALLQDKGDQLIASLQRDIMVIPEQFSITDLHSRFLEKHEHIALVVDDFGGMSGIVTMEDVIETLLGLEIVDELDGSEDMQDLARKNWEKRAQSLGLIEGIDTTVND